MVAFEALFVAVCVMTLVNLAMLGINVKLTTEILKNLLQAKLKDK
jgi:hypothetical protein